MAVSSSVSQNGLLGVKVDAPNAAALSVRSSGNGLPNSNYSSTAEKAPELAEQLNEETKQKYVKGMPDQDGLPNV